MKLLVLRLEGVLQSWGERAKWDDRDSATMPTKSGVIGIITSCMGLPRGDEKIVQISEALNMSVRMERAGRILTDFHTVQGMPKLINAEGKPRSGGNTVISRRQYLQDAAFLIFLFGEEKILDTCTKALSDPVWPPFLGRKCCVPSYPIFAALTDKYTSVEQAIQFYPCITRSDDLKLAQIESITGETNRMDQIANGKERVFKRRQVTYVSVLSQGVDAL